MNRRALLKKSALASAATMVVLSIKEQALAAGMPSNEAAQVGKPSGADLPMGKIRNVNISRVIIDSNQLTGWAHNQDLICVGQLLRHYFTHDKIMDALQLCEEMG